MKEKLIDILYYITVTIFVLAIIISLVFIITDKNLNIGPFIAGIATTLIIPGMFLSPLIILVAAINRIFFDKTSSSNLYKTIIINIIYICITLYTLSNFAI